jgi:hypothetical protein
LIGSAYSQGRMFNGQKRSIHAWHYDRPAPGSKK